MYFIESGKVKIIIQDDPGKPAKELNTLGIGEYFGEIALVNKSPRSASAYADDSTSSEPCKLAFLDLDAFERLMGPCIELLKHKIISYKSSS